MPLSQLQGVKLPASADFHVHLRDGPMMELVTPTIRQGGVNTVFVMPNLVPPITTVDHALDYKKRLQAIEPNVNYLMSLYLHESITPETIVEAKKRGITGVKSYPAGVTTNSSSGVVDYTSFYPVFAEMERQGLILNLHGEAPSKGDVTVLSAEERFLPILAELHARFPKLRIILEHCTTAAAIEAVKQCGPTVAGTITAHHLSIIIDSWAGDPFCFCKPVAKTPADRDALLRAAASGNPKFFFGSDSAPHPSASKRGGEKIAAGVFTQPYTTQVVLDSFEQAVENGVLKDEDITPEIVEGFMSKFGRAFYAIGEEQQDFIKVEKKGEKIVEILKSDKTDVVPFRKTQETWTVTWL
ncbi:putative dihydroorotase [Penicillium oxalicum]|uniref:putative dihydroorotase n=1 Tax=Penicillium oxalicum TaxID=69781 RepID=UPI0020B77734|nr:putative dihydroorotase [Penicillium oxalicum]KAI2790721.1 putative dihydroorotase [Penicillium oxalicum]